MNDKPMEPAEYLKARVEQLRMLLDRQGLHRAAALLAEAIDAIPVARDHQ